MPEKIGTWEFSYISESERKYDNEAEEMTMKTKDIPDVPSERCGEGESFDSWKSTFKTAIEQEEGEFTEQDKLDR